MSRRKIFVDLVVIVLSFVSLLVLAASCAGVPDAPESSQITRNEKVRISDSIVRVIDTEAGVVCWTYYADGISCLPLESTLLK